MAIFVKQLADIIGTSEEIRIRTAISVFSCKDKDVENFLKIKSFENEKRNKSRTYLLIDDSNFAVVAYFTLSLKVLEFQETVSKSKIKAIDGFNKNVKAVPTYLIGQLGKDVNIGGQVTGEFLISLTVHYLLKSQKINGGRAALIECLDIPQVVKFYEDNGFEYLQTDKNDDYCQMFLAL